MILFLSLLAAAAPPSTEPEPYKLGATATADGARQTVTRLLEATFSKDDAGFDKIARGIAFMLAQDFGAPVSRDKLEASFKDCTRPRVVSAEPFPKVPQAQVVRISMQCHTAAHPQPLDAVADVMADNEHAFAIFPGGVAKIWPTKKQ